MRALLGVFLALLFALHTVHAATPRTPDCCEEICVDMACADASCGACQVVAVTVGSGTLRCAEQTTLLPQTPAARLDAGIATIWRPPWMNG